MVADLTRSDVWRALLAGVGYAALCAAGSGLCYGIVRWLDACTTPAWVRLRRWRAWPWLGELAAAAVTLVYVGAMAQRGVLGSADLGLGAPTEMAWRWALGLGLGGALWLGLLVALALPRGASVGAAHEGWSVWAVRALGREAHTAIWRGALMPWLGDYWGVWLAPLGALGTTLLSPMQRAALTQDARRVGVLVGWALDWLGAALYLYTGSAWAAATGRAVCGVLVWGVAQLCGRPRIVATDDGAETDG